MWQKACLLISLNLSIARSCYLTTFYVYYVNKYQCNSFFIVLAEHFVALCAFAAPNRNGEVESGIFQEIPIMNVLFCSIVFEFKAPKNEDNRCSDTAVWIAMGMSAYWTIVFNNNTESKARNGYVNNAGIHRMNARAFMRMGRFRIHENGIISYDFAGKPFADCVYTTFNSVVNSKTNETCCWCDWIANE